jgi:hypothetical protein
MIGTSSAAAIDLRMMTDGLPLPAFDLRQVTLRGAGFLGELATGHPMLGVSESYQPADLGHEVIDALAGARRHRGRLIVRLGFGLGSRHG